jgi:hypothetical protein
MEKTRQERPPVLQVPGTCFVTTIPTKLLVSEGKVRKPDDLIECLERLTGDVRGSLPQPVQENLRVLNAFPGPVVRNPAAEVPAFEASTTDGVVNAMTQILRSPGGIVLADTGTSSDTMIARTPSPTEHRSTTESSAAARASATISLCALPGRVEGVPRAILTQTRNSSLGSDLSDSATARLGCAASDFEVSAMRGIAKCGSLRAT